MRKQKIEQILTFLKRTKGLETAKRYDASLSHGNNTVAEHSWRLALMAYVLFMECKLTLNLERTLALALLHDIAEAKTGDIDAYIQTQQGYNFIEQKNFKEKEVVEDMTSDLSFGESVFSIWNEYEEQKTPESKFIKALDKIEGFLHISEVGVSAYIPKEFHASYADRAVKAFDETTHHFPELNDLLLKIKEDLKKQFDSAGVSWIEK